ncbi:MAG: glycosyltransferase family A protein [Mastigocoleus sp. MO_167.B18]|nr:glycosyltransferase family A protein [Mastigocoleus sp. MO_167.B18]
MNHKPPFVSIIIPVYNDAERLKTCLIPLEEQTYPKDLYEVIIVDNNSEEDITKVVNQFKQARITNESRQGSYAARNQGISVAKGNVFGFTDSDCIPNNDWIEKGVEKLLQIPNCGLVAGEVKLFFKNPEEPTIFEIYDSMNFLRQQYYIEKYNFGATANIFTFKDVFEVVGLFNHELKSGGDSEWGKRVFAAGYVQVYADNVLVSHPARSHWGEIQKKVLRVTEGMYKQGEEQKSLIDFSIEILRDLKSPLKELKRIFQNHISSGIIQKLKLIMLFISVKHIRARTKVKMYFGF